MKRDPDCKMFNFDPCVDHARQVAEAHARLSSGTAPTPCRVAPARLKTVLFAAAVVLARVTLSTRSKKRQMVHEVIAECPKRFVVRALAARVRSLAWRLGRV